jgi:hypothetical protein
LDDEVDVQAMTGCPSSQSNVSNFSLEKSVVQEWPLANDQDNPPRKDRLREEKKT